MAKGYWIVHVDVTNDEGYKPYAAANRRDLPANSAAALWCAPENPKAWRAPASRATW